MELRLVSDDSEVVRLACEGNINPQNSSDGITMFDRVLGSAGGFTRKTLLSLEKVGFIGSSGIGMLLMSHKLFNQAGGRLVLHSLPPMVSNALQLMKMSLVLHIAKDEQSARALALGEAK
jgi:anti-anti-sigma factor